MVFGHNSNLTIGTITLHVQTEDRGETHALIDTTVYYRGRVLHRRTNNYFDLLPLDDDRRQALKLRLEDQHSTVIEEIRSGQLQLAIPPAVVTPPQAESQTPSQPSKLLLELANPKSWLSGKHAKLQLTVREESGEPVSAAQILVQIEGSEDGSPRQTQTDPQGRAEVEFEMPKITGSPAALVIHAENHTAKAQLRFALRAKPRVA